MTLSISWSSLRNHEECHQRSYLLQQKKKNPATNIRLFFPGTVVDRVMRDWLNSDNPLPGEMTEMVDAIMIREEQTAKDTGDGIVRWRNAADKEWVRTFCKTLVERLEPILVAEVLPYDYQAAYRFKVPVTIPGIYGKPQEVNLIGEMDLLVNQGNDRWAVWDLKATQDDSYWRKTIAQLTFYNLGVFGSYGIYPERGGLIQPMCKQQVLETVITDTERLEIMSRIIQMAHSIWRKDFSLAEASSVCAMCSVKHACPKTKTGTLNEGVNLFA